MGDDSGRSGGGGRCRAVGAGGAHSRLAAGSSRGCRRPGGRERDRAGGRGQQIRGDPGHDRLPRAAGRPRHRRHRRGDREPAALPDLLGRAVRGQARAVREAGALRLPADQGGRGARGRQLAAHQARVHVPVRARGPVREAPDRLRVRRRAIHLQRLRAEQPVDRPGDAAAAVRPGRRPGAGGRQLHRGLRRPDHRHHALVARLAADRRRRRDAQLRPRAHDPRHRQDDPGQHR